MHLPRGLKTVLTSSLMSLLLLCANPISAQQNNDKAQTAKITQAQAIQTAKQLVKGKVLRVDRSSRSYRVKMLQDSGRVVLVDVNRTTGKAVKQSQSSSSWK